MKLKKFKRFQHGRDAVEGRTASTDRYVWYRHEQLVQHASYAYHMRKSFMHMPKILVWEKIGYNSEVWFSACRFDTLFPSSCYFMIYLLVKCCTVSTSSLKMLRTT